MQTASWIQRWFHALRAEGRPEAGDSLPPLDLDSIRQVMALVVEPCSADHRMRAGAKILRAPSAVELWLLRTDLYLYLAQDLGQVEAGRRVAVLLPLFKGWLPPAALRGQARGEALQERRLH